MLIKISRNSSVPIMIYGESGTGKELIARNIHLMSDRKDKPFVPINCAMLSDELMESELFGHTKGAFTGADKDKIGLLEKIDKGTLFLDEISEMSPKVQSKFLRVLQDGIIQPLGSNEMKQVDIRFICASNKKLSILVEEKKFRDDLYFRLNVIELEMPNLSERKEDILILVNHFFNKYGQAHRFMESDVLNLLEDYKWPGNIRELENLVRMLTVTTSSSRISIDDLPSKFRSPSEGNEKENIIYTEEYKSALDRSVVEFEKRYITYHLKKNISKTAESINLSRVSLHKKIKEHAIIEE